MPRFVVEEVMRYYIREKNDPNNEYSSGVRVEGIEEYSREKALVLASVLESIYEKTRNKYDTK